MKEENKAISESAPNDIAQTLGINQQSNQGNRRLKWFILIAITVVVATMFSSWFSNHSTESIQYKTSPVIRDDLIVTVTATGTLEPVNQVEVGSEISGTVRTVTADYNDRVEQGQILATLDTDQLQARVNKARATVQLAQAQVKLAEATVRETKNSLKRANKLAQTGLCTEEDCDAAQAGYDRAEASLLSAQAQVVEAQASLDAELTTLSKATIHSPINGIVLNRQVEPGQTVAASLQTPVLFILAEDLTKMELHVDVDEADVGHVEVGQNATFSVDAYPEKSFPAQITEVHFSSQTVEGVVTYETVLRVDNSDLLLRPGMTATADITVQKLKNALLVNNAALRFTPITNTNTTTSGGDGSLLSKLMPRPPASAAKLNNEQNEKQRQVWVLKDAQPLAIGLRVGATDGNRTQVLEGNIQPGMSLIIESFNQSQ